MASRIIPGFSSLRPNGLIRGRLLLLSVLGFFATSIATMAAVPTPTVSVPPAGIKGFPFFSSSLNLASFGYTEKEFLISGKAQSFVNSGTFGNNGEWNVSSGATTPYTTRILVRAPANPGAFNGTVVVEWLNVSGGIDSTPDWAFEHAELLRGGYAWVGVSAQFVGAEFLPTWDSVRYASIFHPGDSWSYDIFSQAGMSILHGNPQPLGALTPFVRRVLAVGESQSAFRLFTYYNAVQPVAGVYQGFLIHSTGFGAALSQSYAGGGLTGATIPTPKGVPATPDIAVPGGAFIRGDLSQPVLFLNTETDVTVLGAGLSVHNQPDSNVLRMWEMAGTTHADLYLLTDSAQDAAKSGETGTTLQCGIPPVNNGPQVFGERAAINALARWVQFPSLPPSNAPRLSLQIVDNKPVLNRDPATGDAIGGIRYPQVSVPIETLTGVRPSGALAANQFCILFGATSPWDGGKDSWDGKAGFDPAPFPAPSLTSLYGSKTKYIAKYTAAAAQSIGQGFLLPEDFLEEVGLAQQASVPDGNAGNASIVPNP